MVAFYYQYRDQVPITSNFEKYFWEKKIIFLFKKRGFWEMDFVAEVVHSFGIWFSWNFYDGFLLPILQSSLNNNQIWWLFLAWKIVFLFKKCRILRNGPCALCKSYNIGFLSNYTLNVNKTSEEQISASSDVSSGFDFWKMAVIVMETAIVQSVIPSVF